MIDGKQLFKDFIKNYGKGWFIPETKKDIDKAWKLGNSFLLDAVDFHVDKYPPPIKDCEDFIMDKDAYYDILNRKLLIAMCDWDGGTEVLFFKYSNGINKYRLLKWGMDSSLWIKTMVDYYYTLPLVMPFYKALMEFTKIGIYCMVGIFSASTNIDTGKPYGLTGYKDKKLGWVWNV